MVAGIVPATAQKEGFLVYGFEDGYKADYAGKLAAIIQSPDKSKPANCPQGGFWTTEKAISLGTVITGCDDGLVWQLVDSPLASGQDTFFAKPQPKPPGTTDPGPMVK
jgi:hypothetical protein